MMINWKKIETRLQREKKADLVALIKELVTQHEPSLDLLTSRYVYAHNREARLKPYKQRLKKLCQQYPFEMWVVREVVGSYETAVPNDPDSILELKITGLEIFAEAVERANFSDPHFHGALTDLADECADKLYSNSAKRTLYAERITYIVNNLSQIDGEAGSVLWGVFAEDDADVWEDD